MYNKTHGGFSEAVSVWWGWFQLHVLLRSARLVAGGRSLHYDASLCCFNGGSRRLHQVQEWNMLAEKNHQGQSKRRNPLSSPSAVWRLAGLLWLNTSTPEWPWIPPTSNSGRKKWSLTGRNLKAGPCSWGQGDTEVLKPEEQTRSSRHYPRNTEGPAECSSAKVEESQVTVWKHPGSHKSHRLKCLNVHIGVESLAEPSQKQQTSLANSKYASEQRVPAVHVASLSESRPKWGGG